MNVSDVLDGIGVSGGRSNPNTTRTPFTPWNVNVVVPDQQTSQSRVARSSPRSLTGRQNVDPKGSPSKGTPKGKASARLTSPEPTHVANGERSGHVSVGQKLKTAESHSGSIHAGKSASRPQVSTGSGNDQETISKAATHKAWKDLPSTRDTLSQKEDADHWGEGVSWEDLRKAFHCLPVLEEGTQEEVYCEMKLDVPKAAKRLGRLRRTAMLLRAVESSPPRDRIVAWVREELWGRRGMEVCQIRALNRRDFLIVFQREEDRTAFLEQSPKFLDGKLVVFVEWNGELDITPLNDRLKAVWVELQNVPPFLEDQAEYQCFQCKGRGHWAKNCPQKRGNPNPQGGQPGHNLPSRNARQEPAGEDVSEDNGNAGFTEVTRRQRRSVHSMELENGRAVQVTNQFDILGQGDPDDPGEEGEVIPEEQESVMGEVPIPLHEAIIEGKELWEHGLQVNAEEFQKWGGPAQEGSAAKNPFVTGTSILEGDQTQHSQREKVVFGENDSGNGRKKGVWKKMLRQTGSDEHMVDKPEKELGEGHLVEQRAGGYRFSDPTSSSPNKRITLSEWGRDGCREMIRLNTDVRSYVSPRNMSGLDQCRIGSQFTRQALREGRVDKARLDRVYLNKSAAWIDHVQEVEHFPNKSISDHGPVSAKLQLVPREDQTGPKANYFKLNYLELKDPDILRRIREAWEDEKLIVQDARRRWMRGWGRIRQTLRQIRNDRSMKDSSMEALEQELDWRTEQLTDGGTLNEVEALRRVEAKLKNLRAREAERWRTRSRERWLKEGEAPTKYFMTRLKAKWARDAIVQLEDEDGELIEDAEGIREEVKSFYTMLYAAEPETEEGREERRLLLQLVERRVSNEDNQELLLLPTREEIEEVVKRLKADKAPGYDGVTAEILRECWGFVGEECIRMVQTVWVKRKMLGKDCQGVITLIPKPGEKRLLKNWRPISLMTLTYKLIAKIEAAQLQLITGVRINDGQSLVCNLFADDTGVFIQAQLHQFLELKKILDRFEKAAGAKINMSKTVLMPLANTPLPDWVNQTGCQVATPEETFRYLGVYVGGQNSDAILFQQVKARMEQRLNHWSNSFLSWNSRVILLKHVLLAIPTYQMMMVGMNSKSAKDLEAVCKGFLWGRTEEGRPKKPLVAWERLIQPKTHGGLGFLSLVERGHSL
ncbi:hypothetical protein R1sor_022688 [Riccia sorocarpa]|uniref:CCHC-type domain-containing protein n=1 Tax=Riccia sorocarpa TaxID=122646 RepID=A0ABD3GNJ5_9MARC